MHACSYTNIAQGQIQSLEGGLHFVEKVEDKKGGGTCPLCPPLDPLLIAIAAYNLNSCTV